MLLCVRIAITGFFLIAKIQLGFSQDIIYNRDSEVEGNISSSEYLSQNSQQLSIRPTQVPLEERPTIEDKQDIPSGLNLFDLTATIEEVEADNETKTLSITNYNKSDPVNKDTNNDNVSNIMEQTKNAVKFENDKISNPDNNILNNNTTDLDQLISELFPAEDTVFGTKKNLESDNSSEQFVTKNILQEQTQQHQRLPQHAVLSGVVCPGFRYARQPF